jgi:predicted amidohydrolase
MEIHYPEIYTTLALKGAEVILWPSAAMDYTGDLMESIVNARAIDNQVYFVAAHFVQMPYLAGKHYGRSRIVDPMGRIRADTGHFHGVAIAEVDLDQTYPRWYEGERLAAYPTMRKTLFRTRRPELYHQLTQPRKEE